MIPALASRAQISVSAPHASGKPEPACVNYSHAHNRADEYVNHANRLILIVLVLGLTGCMSFSERKKENALDHTLSQYRTAMRWGHWDTLFGFRDQKAPAVPEQDLDNVRVTSYEIRQPPVAVKENTVLQVVEIQYVLRNTQLLRKLYEKQEWRYGEEEKLWRLHSPFPQFQ